MTTEEWRRLRISALGTVVGGLILVGVLALLEYLTSLSLDTLFLFSLPILGLIGALAAWNILSYLGTVSTRALSQAEALQMEVDELKRRMDALDQGDSAQTPPAV